MLSAVFAGLAVWLAVAESPARSLGRLVPRGRRRGRGRWRLAPVPLLGLATAALVLAAMGHRGLGWAVAGGVAVALVAQLVLARRARRAAAARARSVASAARLLASLLRAGQIPSVALAEAAEDEPVLAPAAGAAGVGADVAEALTREAEARGAEGLRAVAAAWRISERTGAPVAHVLGGVADGLRHREQVAAVVGTELAAARTSGHIMAALPFGAVGLGHLAGVDTVAFLLSPGLGQWLVAGAVVLVAAGVLWTERMAAA